MIRVSCPKCQKKLGLDDALAGGVGVCPACGAKFRVPKVAAPATPKSSAPSKPGGGAKPVVPVKEVGVKSVVPIKAKPVIPFGKDSGVKPGAPPPASPDKPLAEDDDDDVGGYEVVKDPEPPPEPKKKRRKMDDDEIDEIGVDKEYLRRKKRKTKKKSSDMGMGGALWAGVALTLVWLGMGLMVYFKPATAPIVLGLGGIVSLSGFVWFLVEVFPESTMWGFVCLLTGIFCGPAFLVCAIIFMVTNGGTGLRGFVVHILGSFILFTGYAFFFGAVVSDAIKQQGTQPPASTQPQFQKGPGGMMPQGMNPDDRPPP